MSNTPDTSTTEADAFPAPSASVSAEESACSTSNPRPKSGATSLIESAVCRLFTYMRGFSIATWAGLVAVALVALFYVGYCRMSMVEHEYSWSKYLVCFAFLVVFILLFIRPAIVARYENLLRTCKPLMLVILVYLAFVCFEFPYSTGFITMVPTSLLANLFIIGLFLFATYFFAQRTRGSIMVFLVGALLFGTANFFLIKFNARPIILADLLVAVTGLDVAGNFTYSICDKFALSYAVCCGSCAFAAYMPPALPAAHRLRRVIVNLLVGSLCIGTFALALVTIDIENTFGIRVGTFRETVAYTENGSVLCFLKRVQDITPDAPDGYSGEAAEEILSRYEDETLTADLDEDELPIVICIMNETLADLSTYECLADYYDGLEYVNSLTDSYYTGVAWASVFGYATCNSEFEFLTSVSMTRFRTSVYPYSNYNFDHTTGLASYFKDLGYTAIAMHQNTARNYRRNFVYEQLGFDDYISIDDFYAWPGIEVETLRGHITDKTGYDIILDTIDSTDEPLFFFNVTMQNHNPYDTGLIPDELSVNLGVDLGETTALTEEYLASINASEDDLAYLIDELSQLDRKVVLCVFGDHQPVFAKELINIDLGTDFDTSEVSIEDTQTLYEVSCIIWTNYDCSENSSSSVSGGSSSSSSSSGSDSGLISVSYDEAYSMMQSGTSLNFLAAHVLRAANLPLTSYYNLLLDTERTVAALNSQGYLDTEGTWHWLDEADEEGQEAARESLSDLAIAEYEVMFGKGILYRE